MSKDSERPLTGQPAGGASPPSPSVSALSGAHQAHTPGPWRHNQVFNGYELVRDEILSDSGVIADDIRDPRDACLIAAAPDMLSALEEADARISMLHSALDISAKRNQAGVLDAEQRKRRTAIAKARGLS